MSERKKKPTTGIYSSRHPQWLDTNVPAEYEDDDLFQIILFYVFYSPCGKSQQGKTLDSRGWGKHPWVDPEYLENKLDEIIFSDKSKKFYVADKKEDFPEVISEKKFDSDFYQDRDDQRIALVKVSKQCRYMSLFHHIRNALAHGRIAMYPACDDVMFVMEDGNDVGKASEDKFEVAMRAVIRKSTLLKLAKYIIEGPKEESPLISRIKAAIRGGKNKKGEIMDELNLSKNDWEKIKKWICDDYKNEIIYKSGKWCVIDQNLSD